MSSHIKASARRRRQPCGFSCRPAIRIGNSSYYLADEQAPNEFHVVTPNRQLRAKEGAVEGWQLHNPAPGRYECHWRWE